MFAVSLTSGLHGPRVILTMAKTFDDFVVISVICFAQDNLQSNFTPKYEWLATLESGFQVNCCYFTWVTRLYLTKNAPI